VIVVLLIPLLLGAGAWVIIRAGRTAGPVWRASDHDGAWSLVVLATSCIPEGRSGWGAAIRAEFESVEGRGARWRFALGCLRTALLPPRGIGATGRGFAGAVMIALGACTGLQVYGRVRYPTGIAGAAGYGAVFVMFLVVSVWMTLFGRPTIAAEARVARWYGTVGGVAVGALYVAAVSPSSNGRYAALLGGIGCAIAVPALASRASGDPRTGVRAGLWVGLISGLVFFIGLMTLTYFAAGWWTHDHEAVSVYNAFGPVTEHGHSLAQWPGFAAFLARRESAVALLVGFILAPVSGVAAGAVGGLLGGHRHRGRRHRRRRLAAGPA
jgi:hypothetical protein